MLHQLVIAWEVEPAHCKVVDAKIWDKLADEVKKKDEKAGRHRKHASCKDVPVHDVNICFWC